MDPPLIVACNNGHVELSKFLLDNGADPNVFDSVC